MLLSSAGDALFMFHVGSESPEHDEEEGKAGEDDAHGENGDAVAVRICFLEHLGLAESGSLR